MTYQIEMVDELGRRELIGQLMSAEALRRELAELTDRVEPQALVAELEGEAPLAGGRGVVRFGPLC
jgi:hypothetical protein